MKQHVLGDHLYRFQWVGVIYNVVSVFMVGSTAILSSSEKEVEIDTDTKGSGTALLGVLLVMFGALVQAMVSYASIPSLYCLIRAFTNSCSDTHHNLP
jgi:hypothetical protein